MHGQSTPLVLDPTSHSLSNPLRLPALALVALTALQSANTAQAQNLNAEPLFGSIVLEAGTAATPHTVQVSPGGEDDASALAGNCNGYIRFAQPDFVLGFQSSESPLGIFSLSDIDTTMAISDPAGNWHCNDDSIFLSDTNSGIQFNDPLSGDYQIWVGSYDLGAESISTMLVITEADESEWASLPVGLEDSVYAASFDLNGDIVFGDDSGGFANDGECDDPRFQGPGAAFGSSNHLFKDASDCRAQFDAGLVSLAEPEDMNLSGDISTDTFGADADIFGDSVATSSPFEVPDAGPFGEVFSALVQAFQAIPGDDADALPLPFGTGGAAANSSPAYDRDNMTALTGIDFGDNSSLFADDGECDDPRFEGPGAAGFTFDDGELTDGNDCSSLFLQGSLTYIDPASTAMVDADPAPAPTTPTGQTISIGNTQPSAPTPAPPEETYTIGVPRGDINSATQADGSIFASGSVYGDPLDPNSPDTRGGNLMPSTTTATPAPPRAASSGAIDFGDNSSVFANDGECDDPRFEGDGAASVNFDDDRGRDADDCRAAYEAGTVTLIGN